MCQFQMFLHNLNPIMSYLRVGIIYTRIYTNFIILGNRPTEIVSYRVAFADTRRDMCTMCMCVRARFRWPISGVVPDRETYETMDRSSTGDKWPARNGTSRRKKKNVRRSK